MNRRIKSIELMQILQPFMQGNLLSAQNAGEIVSGYVAGNDEPLKSFVNNPALPMAFMTVTQQLKAFISQGGNK